MQSMMGKITSVEDLKEFVNSVDDLVDTVGGGTGDVLQPSLPFEWAILMHTIVTLKVPPRLRTTPCSFVRDPAIRTPWADLRWKAVGQVVVGLLKEKVLSTPPPLARHLGLANRI